MKRTTILTLALILVVGVSTALAGSHEKSKTIEGTLVDSKCYLTAGATGNDHGNMKNCGTACAKMGIPVGILTADGKYVTLVVSSMQVADHIGQTVRAKGAYKNNALIPEKLKVKSGEQWEEVKLGT